MGRRRQSREIVVQALYLTDTSSMSAADAYVIAKHPDLDEKSDAFCRRLLDGAAENQEALDREIETTAQNWELSRMAAVDRSILRLAAFELIHCADTPISVVIDEALEIAKKYASEDSSKFINGILGKLKDRAMKRTE